VTLTATDAFAAFVTQQQEQWGKVIRDNSLKAG
jgi:hypothetical protein